jgi:Aspartyl protease
MPIIKLLTSVSLAAFTVTALRGERHCPGNVPSVPLRLVHGALIATPIMINGSGPFDFVVDTGAQISTVDAALAKQLGLRANGTVGITGVASYQRTPYLQLTRMEMGGHRLENVLAVIEELAQLHSADANIQGIVAQNFLAHFDLLIDNEHRMLCLDETDAMASAMKGAHMTLAQPYGPHDDPPFTRPFLIAAQIDGNKEPLLFRLDSGSNAPVIYGKPKSDRDSIPASARILGRDTNGVERDFALLAPQNVAVGPQRIGQVSFVELMKPVGAAHEPREDGLLPTQLFRSVLVSYREQYAILNPR